MKIVTVLGTRSEIIRLSRIIPKLDQIADHVLVNTGQNFDPNLSAVFFADLALRRPQHELAVDGPTPARQIAQILERCEAVFVRERPDRVLILGDTNSALCAIVAKRMQIPVFHMEAGNRCYDDRVAEEVNRRIVDHSSDLLMPYTAGSRDNLLREGISPDRIVVTGNPILEVIEHYRPNIERSNVLDRLALAHGRFFLVTLHRGENVDIEQRLRSFVEAWRLLSDRYGFPVIVSTHPRTADRMRRYGIGTDGSGIRLLEPFGFFDFIKLEENAACVLSDSGTVQEECAILHVRNVTLRDVTERPETVACGSNVLSGADVGSILACVEGALGHATDWTPPPEYLVRDVSDVAVRIVAGSSPHSH